MEPKLTVCTPHCHFLALSILIAFTCAQRLGAQEEAVIKNITSSIAESLPEEEDLSAFTERLEFYKRTPIILGKATPEQLKELFFLSPLQISSFFSHLQTNGPLKDILELQAIDGFDLETINRLLPFVTIKAESEFHDFSLGRLLEKGKHELLLRYGQVIEKQKGFRALKGSHYLGSPAKLLIKYKYNLSNLIRFSFVLKKDAGERLFYSPKNGGFDYLSSSLSITKSGGLKQLILGDYGLQFGQGLALWSGSSFGKGPDVTGAAKKDSGLKSYTSINEFSFFRGVAAVYKVMNSVEITSFVSTRNLDASLSTSENGEEQLTTIGMSGLHRTATEINHKGSLGQLLYGTALSAGTTNFDLGISAYHTRYSHEFIKGNPLYRQFTFTGTSLSNLSFFYNYTYKNLYIFGETAKSLPGGIAFLNGVMATLNPKVSVVILHREYAKDYHSFYTKSFGESSTSSNEKGIYAGLHFSPNRKWSSAIYMDIFHFPGAKYRIDGASSGYDLMAQVIYAPNKKLKTGLKISTKKSEQNESSALPVNPLVSVRKNNGRLQSDWKINAKFNLENRIEVTRYHKGIIPESYGFMLYQDVGYSPLSSKFSGNMRLAFFNTPTYENRIYAYEDDVLYGAGSGLYNGKGLRTYCNINYRINHQIRLWLRYAIYWYPGEKTTGSGLDEINGNKKSEIKFQLRYQF